MNNELNKMNLLQTNINEICNNNNNNNNNTLDLKEKRSFSYKISELINSDIKIFKSTLYALLFIIFIVLIVYFNYILIGNFISTITISVIVSLALKSTKDKICRKLISVVNRNSTYLGDSIIYYSMLLIWLCITFFVYIFKVTLYSIKYYIFERNISNNYNIYEVKSGSGILDKENDKYNINTLKMNKFLKNTNNNFNKFNKEAIKRYIKKLNKKCQIKSNINNANFCYKSKERNNIKTDYIKYHDNSNLYSNLKSTDLINLFLLIYVITFKFSINLCLFFVFIIIVIDFIIRLIMDIYCLFITKANLKYLIFNDKPAFINKNIINELTNSIISLLVIFGCLLFMIGLSIMFFYLIYIDFNYFIKLSDKINTNFSIKDYFLTHMNYTLSKNYLFKGNIANGINTLETFFKNSNITVTIPSDIINSASEYDYYSNSNLEYNSNDYINKNSYIKLTNYTMFTDNCYNKYISFINYYNKSYYFENQKFTLNLNKSFNSNYKKYNKENTLSNIINKEINNLIANPKKVIEKYFIYNNSTKQYIQNECNNLEEIKSSIIFKLVNFISRYFTFVKYIYCSFHIMLFKLNLEINEILNKYLGHIYLILSQFIQLFLVTIISYLITFSQDVVNFIMLTIIFITCIFYMLKYSDDNSDLVIYSLNLLIPIKDKNLLFNIAKEFKKSLEGIFISTFEIFIYHIVLTWLFYDINNVPFSFMFSLISGVVSVLPIFSPYLMLVPGILYVFYKEYYILENYSFELLLYNNLDYNNYYNYSNILSYVISNFYSRCLFIILKIFIFFVSYVFASNKIINDVYKINVNAHPYITGMSFIMGFYTWGIIGIIYGPVVLCFTLLLRNLFMIIIDNKEYFKYEFIS